MKTMLKMFLAVTVGLMLVGGFGVDAFAADQVRTLNQKLAMKKDICTAVRECIQEDRGIYTKETVKISLNMGYALCYVVKCALDAGGTLNQTILGAQEAGFTEDAVESCAVNNEYPYTREASYKKDKPIDPKPPASPSRF
ncbi:MAG: hypothetical protein HZB33_00280 [Nitrospirae bacterium]|nr:hypothetical protein [Nitrospirota bacterium]